MFGVRGVVAVLVVALAVSVGGCGGDDDAEIRETLDAYFTSKDPKAVCQSLSREFLKIASTGGSGGNATQGCEERVRKGDGQTAKSVQIVKLTIKGDIARVFLTTLPRVAAAHAHGKDVGPLDTVVLNEDGKWKLDSLNGEEYCKQMSAC